MWPIFRKHKLMAVTLVNKKYMTTKTSFHWNKNISLLFAPLKQYRFVNPDQKQQGVLQRFTKQKGFLCLID